MCEGECGSRLRMDVCMYVCMYCIPGFTCLLSRWSGVLATSDDVCICVHMYVCTAGAHHLCTRDVGSETQLRPPFYALLLEAVPFASRWLTARMTLGNGAPVVSGSTPVCAIIEATASRETDTQGTAKKTADGRCGPDGRRSRATGHRPGLDDMRSVEKLGRLKRSPAKD